MWLENIALKLKKYANYNVFIFSPYSLDGIFCFSLLKDFLSHRLDEVVNIQVGVTSYGFLDITLEDIFSENPNMQNVVFLINYRETLSLIDEKTLRKNDSIIFLLNRYEEIAKFASTRNSNERIVRVGEVVQNNEKIRTPPKQDTEELDANTEYFKQREDVGKEINYTTPSTFKSLIGIFGSNFSGNECPEKLVTELVKCTSCSAIHELVSGRMPISTYRNIFSYLERIISTFRIKNLKKIEEFNIPQYRHRKNFLKCLRFSEEHVVQQLSKHGSIRKINQYASMRYGEDLGMDDLEDLKCSFAEFGVQVGDLEVSFDSLPPRTKEKVRLHVCGGEDFEFDGGQKLVRYFDGMKGPSYSSFECGMWDVTYGMSDILYSVMTCVSSLWDENVTCNYKCVTELEKFFYPETFEDFKKLKREILIEASEMDRIYEAYWRCLLHSLIENPFEERYGFFFARGIERLGEVLEGPFGMDLLGRTCYRLIKRNSPVILTSRSVEGDDNSVLVVYEPINRETGLTDVVRKFCESKKRRTHSFEGCTVVRLRRGEVGEFVDEVEKQFRDKLVEKSIWGNYFPATKLKKPEFSSPGRMKRIKKKKKKSKIVVKKKKGSSRSRELFKVEGKEYGKLEESDRIRRRNQHQHQNVSGRKRSRRGIIDFSNVESRKRRSKRRKR